MPDDSHPSAKVVIDLYRRHARAWRRARAASDFVERTWIDRFAALSSPGGAMLDIGCGSGAPVGARLVELGHPLTGVDAAEPLIAAARTAMPTQTWAVADMRALDLGRRFDGLIAWHSLFHLSQADQRRMFAVFGRHANPGAVLMFTSGPRAGVALGRFEGEVLHHASLSAAAYRALLAAEGFAVSDHAVEDGDAGGATVCLATKTMANTALAARRCS